MDDKRDLNYNSRGTGKTEQFIFDFVVVCFKCHDQFRKYDCDHFMTVKAQEESDMYWELKHCSFFQGHMRNIQVKQH